MYICMGIHITYIHLYIHTQTCTLTYLYVLCVCVCMPAAYNAAGYTYAHTYT